MIEYKGVLPRSFISYTIGGVSVEYIINNNDRVYIDGKLAQEGIQGFEEDIIVYITDHGNEMYLHREDGPAMIETFGNEKYAYYHVMGMNFKVEDMPVDEHNKCILVLKEGGRYKKVARFHGYIS